MCKSLNVAVNKCINECFVHLYQEGPVDADIGGESVIRGWVKCEVQSARCEEGIVRESVQGGTDCQL